MKYEEKTELQAFNGSEDDAEAGEMFCTKCGKKNRTDSAFCGYCGNPFTSFVKYEQEYSKTEISDVDFAYYRASLHLKQQELEEVRKQTELQRKQLQLERQQHSELMKCPRCGSTSLSGNKKGYGIGKGVIGAAVFGPIGLIAGNIGSKKVIVTCMNCGYKYKV